MAENYEPGKWDAVVCNGFAAVNVLSSTNVEELGWDYTEMELDPTGTCGLFDGMLLDWDDDTPDERREHEEYFPDAFTVGARILADDWDHELGNDEVRSRCFLIIEHADQFTDHDTGRDWLCESTLADFSEVEAMTFFQNLTLMEPQDIARLYGLPIIPSAGPEECRAAVLAFNQKMVARRAEEGTGDLRTRKGRFLRARIRLGNAISRFAFRRCHRHRSPVGRAERHPELLPHHACRRCGRQEVLLP